MDPRLRDVARFAITQAIAALGGLAFRSLGLPSPWLSGGMTAVAIAAMAGVPLHMPESLRRLTLVVLGVALGAGVTPATIAGMGLWPVSLLILAVTVVAIVAASSLYLQRISGFDRQTALFASVPGALSSVLATASESGADMARTALVQNIRLFVLIAVVPSVAGAGTPPSFIAHAGLLETLALLALGALCGLLFERLRVPAGLLLGAMLPSGLGHGTGYLAAVLPDAVTILAFTALGASVGMRFAGFDRHLFISTARSAAGSLVITAGIAALGSTLVWQLLEVPFESALVAFAPGALEGMTALAFSLHLDPAYVGTHHLARFLGIALVLPLVAGALRR